MKASRPLRSLALPAAVVLGTSLALACSSGVPTAPDQVTAATSFKKGNALQYRDDDGALGCPSGYFVLNAASHPNTDHNDNGYICRKGV